MHKHTNTYPVGSTLKLSLTRHTFWRNATNTAVTEPPIRAVKLLHSQPKMSPKLSDIQVEFMVETNPLEYSSTQNHVRSRSQSLMKKTSSSSEDTTARKGEVEDLAGCSGCWRWKSLMRRRSRKCQAETWVPVFWIPPEEECLGWITIFLPNLVYKGWGATSVGGGKAVVSSTQQGSLYYLFTLKR